MDTIRRRNKVKVWAKYKEPYTCWRKKEEKLRLLEDESKDSGFDKVISESGVIGYVKASDLKEAYDYVPKTDFVEEEYPHTLLDGKVNLLWHQVTNQTANSTLLNVISGTKM